MTKELSGETALDLLNKYQAFLKEDHFVLASGQHSREYVNKRALTQAPSALHKIAQLMSMYATPHKESCQLVIGPADGAITLSFALALCLSQEQERNVQHTFAAKQRYVDPSGFTDRFAFNNADSELITGKRIVLVEDILTTGESLKKVVDLVKAQGGIPIGACAIWNRNAVTAEHLGVPVLHSLIEVQLESWPPDKCPLCINKVPINTIYGKGKEYLQGAPSSKRRQ